MPAIWAIMRAIRGSVLPSTDRHILMTLASLADAETGIIPDRFMPSFTDLSRFTGLGRSTVARRLPFIEEAGWIKRTAPSLAAAWRDKEKNSYALLVPIESSTEDSDDEDPEPEPTSPRAGLVPQRDQSEGQSQSGTSPTAGPVLVPEGDRTSPTAGLEVPNLRTKRTNTPPSEVLFGVAAEPSSPAIPPQRKPKKTKPKVGDIPRPDAEEICEYLAAAVIASGSRTPTISDKWRTEARLLLDEKRDPQATVEKVKALIDWIKNNDWWKPRIQAMPKLREKYDEIRLDALRDFKRKQDARNGQPRSSQRGVTPPYRNPEDQQAYLDDWKAPQR